MKTRSPKIAEKICETIGTVSKPADNTEVDGDGFIRVRVKVDVSKPLCRGRVISLENGRELWVSFKYECLPNLCYWCGCLTHADKDCDLWIDSEGTLQLETQQYGPWIRAQPFTRTRKNVVVVPGFYSKKSNSTKAAPSNQSRKPPMVVVRKGGPSPEIIRSEKEGEVQSVTTDSAPDIQGEDPLFPNQIPTVQLYPNIADPVFMAEKKSDEIFEEQIQEIDRELSKFEANREHSRDKQEENNLEFLTINGEGSSTKVYSRALNSHPLKCRPASALADISNNPELNIRRWKRINRAETESDIVMEDAVGEKRSGREEDQPELLKKLKLVSRVDEVVTNILAEAGSQPHQNQ
uniref:Zinc knuckle CX2CX4HX4C domain-containing protein n=1 Tax=Quercus lobata TaxID=97700 RepID=A0A7N2KMA2_QUELO